MERIDLLAAVPDRTALLGLGRNRVGPADGLYVLEEGADRYRVYRQERGDTHDEVIAGFDPAREAAIDLLIALGGIPLHLPGGRDAFNR